MKTIDFAQDINFLNEADKPRASIGVAPNGAGYLDLANKEGSHLAVIGADGNGDGWLFMYDHEGKPYASITKGGTTFNDRWPVYGYNRTHDYSLKWSDGNLHFIVDGNDVGTLPDIAKLEARIATLEAKIK